MKKIFNNIALTILFIGILVVLMIGFFSIIFNREIKDAEIKAALKAIFKPIKEDSISDIKYQLPPNSSLYLIDKGKKRYYTISKNEDINKTIKKYNWEILKKEKDINYYKVKDKIISIKVNGVIKHLYKIVYTLEEDDV